MFSNSTQFTQESCVSTKPWPMHPCHVHDLSHAFWLARTQTPRNVRLHHWILLGRMVILIPFDGTCSSGCDFIYIHKLYVKFKKCLKYSKWYLKCVRKLNPWYNGDCVPWKYLRGQTLKSPTTGVWIDTSPFGNQGPSCEMVRFGRSDHQNLCQTLPIFFPGTWEQATGTHRFWWRLDSIWIPYN